MAYIERKVVLDVLCKKECCVKERTGICKGCDLAMAFLTIPAADVEPVVRGWWIPDGYTVCCSECKTLGSPQWKRCPVCEAKMEGKR